jgi:hypothetical protein
MGFAALKKNKTRDNAPGLRKNIWIAERDWFVENNGLKKPGAGTNPGDSLRITDSHNFKEGFGFVRLHTTLGTTQLTGEMLGDKESRTNKPTLVGKHPGLTAEIVEFFQKTKSGDWITLVETVAGEIIQIGEDGLECEIMFSFDSGLVESGYQGVTATIENTGKIYFYEGDIIEHPASPPVIDPE